MIKQLRSLAIAMTALLSSAAFAQPLPPYYVNVSGSVTPCSPANSYVNILTVQGTQPALDIDVPLDSACHYSITLVMDSPQGWFQVSTPCSGAMQFASGSYAVNTFDTLSVVININCGGSGTDCLGVPGGSALPGTACTTFLGQPGTWSAACQCVANSTTCQACFTVSQASNGPAGPPIPFTAQFNNCTAGNAPFTYAWTFDGGVTFINATSPTYTFPAGTHMACLTIADANGCTSTTCDSLLVDSVGTINPVNTLPCEADFWVMQGYTFVDSTTNPNGGGVEPIPNEVWVWNLSSGGSGNYQFLWNFGDGTSSSAPYPTHIYANGGPYNLCLTMYDASGCTDTQCDSVSIDANGFYTGLAPEPGGGTLAGFRSGFTLNVISELPTSVPERNTLEDIALWPNPVNDAIGLSLVSTLNGRIELSVMDLNGRTVMSTSDAVNSGNNRFSMPVSELLPGMYLLRITDGTRAVSRRFVKQ